MSSQMEAVWASDIELSRPACLAYIMGDVLYLKGYVGCGEYGIELYRCDTPAKILGWLCHLEKKRWITKGHLVQFTALALLELGVEKEFA